jgi:hypothetical protein
VTAASPEQASHSPEHDAYWAQHMPSAASAEEAAHNAYWASRLPSGNALPEFGVIVHADWGAAVGAVHAWDSEHAAQEPQAATPEQAACEADAPLTHFFHCWRFPDHHACAVALIERQGEEYDQQLVRAGTAERELAELRRAAAAREPHATPAAEDANDELIGNLARILLQGGQDAESVRREAVGALPPEITRMHTREASK